MSTAPPPEPRTALPNDVEAERTLLGATLVDNGAWTQVGRLKAQDFYRDGHRRIFVALQHIASRGGEMDTLTLKAQLGSDLQAAGGPAYLAALTDGLPRITNVGSWVAIVRRHALLRSIHHIGQRLAEKAMEDDADPETLLERADAHILDILTRRNGAALLDNADLVRDAIREATERADAEFGIVGYRTGILSLDKILQGIHGNRLVLIAARLGKGKSTLALQMAAQIAAQISVQEPGKVVVFSSLEMSGKQLMARRMAAAAGVSSSNLWQYPPAVRAERLAKLARAGEMLAKSNLRIVKDAYTVRDLRARCRQVQQEHGLGAVVADYAQLMESEQRGRNRREEMTTVSHGLKRLCEELRVPVLVVAQLNRDGDEAVPRKGVERRPPDMSNIAECDDFGRDADVGILIDRDPPRKDEPKQKDHGRADLIVAKNRGGIDGVSTRVRFIGATSTFCDDDEGFAPPGSVTIAEEVGRLSIHR